MMTRRLEANRVSLFCESNSWRPVRFIRDVAAAKLPTINFVTVGVAAFKFFSPRLRVSDSDVDDSSQQRFVVD